MTLADEDYYKIPPTSEYDMRVANWLFLTVAQTALHDGVIELMHALTEGKKKRPC